MYRFYPVTSAIWSKLRSPRSVADAAVTRIEICPPERGEMPGVLLPDEDRARITAVQSETTFAHEMERVAGRMGDHRATVRYELRDVLVTPEGIFGARDAFHKVGTFGLNRIPRGEIPVFDRGFYALSQISSRYFGHWLRDGLPTAYLKRPEELLCLHAPPAWPHAQEYLDLLGLDVAPQVAFFRTLAVCEDVGMNSSRRDRLARLKSDIRSHFEDGPKQRVFLSRGQTGVARALVNEPEIVDRLRSEGFRILTMNQPLNELLGVLGNASLVVSMEGSHCAHAMMAAPRDWRFVVINPADRFNNIFVDYMPAIGGRLATTVADRSGDGYHVDPDHLMRVIAMVEAA